MRLLRKSAVGAGGVAIGTAFGVAVGSALVKLSDLDRAAASAITVKSGATAFATGTITDQFDRVNLNARAIWEWMARGDEEKIEVPAGGIFGINILVSVASIVITVTVWFEE